MWFLGNKPVRQIGTSLANAIRASRKTALCWRADVDLAQAADFAWPTVKLFSPAPGLCLQCVELAQ